MQQALEFATSIGWVPPLTSEMNSHLAALPEPPCMPSAMLRMELLLKASSADLGAICNVIRNDIGLSLGLLRLSSIAEDLPTHIQEMVLCLGTDELRSWVRRRSLLGPACPSCRFAMTDLSRHARLVARVAEIIAPFIEGANREEVYLGALLHDLGKLPGILGWSARKELGANTIETGLILAKAWQLPDFVLDAIQPERKARPITPLGRVVSAAHDWAIALEKAMLMGAEKHPHLDYLQSIAERWLPSVKPEDFEIMCSNLNSCTDPWLH